MDLTQLTMLEWKLLMIWDDLIESHERNLRIYAKALFEAMSTRGF